MLSCDWVRSDMLDVFLGQARGQAGKLTKDLEKKDAVDEKKRDALKGDISKTKSEVQSLQEQLKTAQAELARLKFDLQGKTGES